MGSNESRFPLLFVERLLLYQTYGNLKRRQSPILLESCVIESLIY